MLALTLRENQKLYIGNDIVVIAKKDKRSKNKIVIIVDAPKEIQIRRGQFKKKNNGKSYDEGFFINDDTE